MFFVNLCNVCDLWSCAGLRGQQGRAGVPCPQGLHCCTNAAHCCPVSISSPGCKKERALEMQPRGAVCPLPALWWEQATGVPLGHGTALPAQDTASPSLGHTVAASCSAEGRGQAARAKGRPRADPTVCDWWVPPPSPVLLHLEPPHHGSAPPPPWAPVDAAPSAQPPLPAQPPTPTPYPHIYLYPTTKKHRTPRRTVPESCWGAPCTVSAERSPPSPPPPVQSPTVFIFVYLLGWKSCSAIILNK